MVGGLIMFDNQAPWTSTTTVKEELAPFKVIVDLSHERPIHMIVGTVTLQGSVNCVEDMIDELRKAIRMVRAAEEPDPPNLRRVK
jgi:hypothetical protein